MKWFFRNMSKSESINWRKGAILGFYIYLLLLFINYTCSLLFEKEPFTSSAIFWTGLIAAFGCEFILNLSSKKKLNSD